MRTALADIFSRAGCTGQLCVRDAASGQTVDVDADALAVPASVIKVLVAVEAERQFADGRLDRLERVILDDAERTPGPVGLSLYRHDVTMCLDDLLVPMLTISDNVATDALLNRVGVESCNRTASQLGLEQTVITSDLRAMIDSMAHDAGFSTWTELLEWSTAPRPDSERAAVDEKVRRARALDPDSGMRTTARDMCRLLEAVWSDVAAPASGCARIRDLMGQQLTKHRLASALRPPIEVAAKSGGLAGVVRNEVGAIYYPDGSRYIAAVFTRSTGGEDAAINAAIGAAAAAAIGQLRGEPVSAGG